MGISNNPVDDCRKDKESNYSSKTGHNKYPVGWVIAKFIRIITFSPLTITAYESAVFQGCIISLLIFYILTFGIVLRLFE